MFTTETIVENIQWKTGETLTKTKMRKLYQYCQMSSALVLRHPELIYLKWMSQDEFDEAIKNLEE